MAGARPIASPSGASITFPLRGKQFAAAIPCRRYWRHNLNTENAGHRAQWRLYRRHSLPLPGRPGALAAVLVSYLGSGNYRDRYLGIKIPPTNLQASHLQSAREFADALAKRLLSTGDAH